MQRFLPIGLCYPSAQQKAATSRRRFRVRARALVTLTILLGSAREVTSGQQGPPGTAPVLSASLERSLDVEVYRGWPWLLRAQVLHPLSFEPQPPPDVRPLVITAPTGPWSQVISFEVRDARDAQREWPLRLANEPGERLVLDLTRGGEAGWWVLPAESRSITPGEYLLRAVLDTTASPEDAPELWKGIVRSAAIRVRVLDEPNPLPHALEENKLLRLANFALAEGDVERATGHVDALLARQPESIGALIAKGDLLLARGKTREAFDAYDRALTVFDRRYPETSEPPVSLLRRRNELFNEILEASDGEVRAFRRGDTNGDGRMDIVDAIVVVGFLFLGTPAALECSKAADTDDNGRVDLADAVGILQYLFFRESAAPRDPFEDCGTDPTADALGCASYPPCAPAP